MFDIPLHPCPTLHNRSCVAYLRTHTRAGQAAAVDCISTLPIGNQSFKPPEFKTQAGPVHPRSAEGPRSHCLFLNTNSSNARVGQGQRPTSATHVRDETHAQDLKPPEFKTQAGLAHPRSAQGPRSHCLFIEWYQQCGTTGLIHHLYPAQSPALPLSHNQDEGGMQAQNDLYGSHSVVALA